MKSILFEIHFETMDTKNKVLYMILDFLCSYSQAYYNHFKEVHLQCPLLSYSKVILQIARLLILKFIDMIKIHSSKQVLKILLFLPPFSFNILPNLFPNLLTWDLAGDYAVDLAGDSVGDLEGVLEGSLEGDYLSCIDNDVN